MSAVKPFLARAAATPITASPNFQGMADDGCDPKIIAAFKHLAQHSKMVYAQYEDGANMAQCEIRPESDAVAEYGAKVFSVPTMIELGNVMKMLSAIPNTESEVHISTEDRAHPSLIIVVASEPS